MMNSRKFAFALLVTSLILPVALAQDRRSRKQRRPSYADPALAARHPDFDLQGEYAGKIKTPNGQLKKVGVQVVARGRGQFTARPLLCPGPRRLGRDTGSVHAYIQ